jgi:hypothetical protein
MPLDYELLELMTEEVQIRPAAGTDAYGKPTYEPARTVRARIEDRNRIVRDTFGKEVVSSSTVYLAEVVDVPVSSQVLFPDGRTPAVLVIETVTDEDGPLITKLYT